MVREDGPQRQGERRKEFVKGYSYIGKQNYGSRYEKMLLTQL